MCTFFKRIRLFLKNEEGSESIEWSTILMVSVGLLIIITAIGVLMKDKLQGVFDYLTDSFDSIGTGGTGTGGGTSLGSGLTPPD